MAAAPGRLRVERWQGGRHPSGSEQRRLRCMVSPMGAPETILNLALSELAAGPERMVGDVGG